MPLLNSTWSSSGTHLYLGGQAASSSTSGTTQIVFGSGTSTSSFTQHVVLSSNNECVIVNPSTSSTTGQICLYCGSNPRITINGNAIPTMSTGGHLVLHII